MAEISSFLFMRHLRAEPTSFLSYSKNGRVKKQGRGLAFWFVPLGASVVEVPLDDRELNFHFNTRSRDFQQVTAQGVITFRVVHPEVIAGRVSFALDKKTGAHVDQPLDALALTLTQLAQERAIDHIARAPLRELLASPLEALRVAIHDGLSLDAGLKEMGLEIVSTRVARISPTAEMEKALQMPTRESIQQTADEATFQRRALAVEKERAIAENEMSTQIELAKREQKLIDQRGLNQRRTVEEHAEAERIRVASEAEKRKIASTSEAEAIAALEAAKNDAERARMDIYRDLPQGALFGLAARELASKLQKIEHLNLSPDLLGPLLQRLGSAGAKALEEKK